MFLQLSVILFTGDGLSMGGVPGRPPPPYVKGRVVRILLECILVAYSFDYPIDIAIS